MCWGQDRDPIVANEADGQNKHMALRVQPVRGGGGEVPLKGATCQK